MSESNEESCSWDSGWSHFEHWYHKAVKDYEESWQSEREEEIERKLSAEEDVIFEELREHMDEWLHETLDGCEEVIYTAQSKVVLLISSNEGAFEEFGYDELPSLSVRAFCALKRDVEERIFG